MAIKTFKEIIDNKGYRVDSKDRKIFEEGNLQSFFGFGENDVIEFIVYDVSDNQLPQKDGSLVRYISLSTESISDYFMVPEGVLFEKNQLPKEYFIDVERLLREAGYNNGVFKTQITLLNFRLGNNLEPNKVWISEISPSRLEVRLLPIRNLDRKNNNLEEQFSIFVNGGEFRDDTLQNTPNFIETISPQTISSVLIGKYGKKYFDTFLAEYKVGDFDLFVGKIHTKFLEAAKHEFSNKISNIRDVNYGKPKSTPPSIKLSVSDIRRESIRIFVEIIDYYLYTPEVKVDSTFNQTVSENVEKVDIVKKVDSGISKQKITIGEEVELKEKIITKEKEVKSDKEKKLKILVEKELGIDKGRPIVEKAPKEKSTLGGDFALGGGPPGGFNRGAQSILALPNPKNITISKATSVGELNNKTDLVSEKPVVANELLEKKEVSKSESVMAKNKDSIEE
jgi:hypothetical protein